jgi:uncharacterized RDD family membrane protein YckC
MGFHWEEDEDEDETVVEGEKLVPPPRRERFEKGDETVAFTRKSDLDRERFIREEATPLSSSAFFPQRYPLRAALPRDRFAAFFIDTLLLVFLNLLLGRFLRRFLFTLPWFSEFSDSWQMGVRIFALFVAAMIYYVFFEAIAGATPGKFLCRLRVVDLEGNVPPIASVFLRNICRLFDYPLLFLVALLSMESSAFYQRLGDRAAHTVVIKKTRKRLTPVDLRSAPLSSTFVRALGFLIDLIFYLLFLWLYASAMNPEKVKAYQFLFWLFPFVAGCYFMIFEFATSTTPGKFLLNRLSVLENGEPLDASAAILRNLVRPLDMILGYPLLALTRRKQRLGDLLADTLVIKKKNNRNGAISLACLALVLLTLGYLSSRNPNRTWFHPFLKMSWKGSETAPINVPSKSTPIPPAPTVSPPALPKLESPPSTFPSIPGVPKPTVTPTTPPAATTAPPIKAPGKGRPQTTSQTLKTTEFYFSAGPDPVQIRSDNTFHRGDLIFAFFKVAGFQRSSAGDVKLIEDVRVEGPDGETWLNKAGIVNFSQRVQNGSQHILFANQLTLPADAPPGVYNLIIVIRNGYNQEQMAFEKSLTLQ